MNVSLIRGTMKWRKNTILRREVEFSSIWVIESREWLATLGGKCGEESQMRVQTMQTADLPTFFGLSAFRLFPVLLALLRLLLSWIQSVSRHFLHFFIDMSASPSPSAGGDTKPADQIHFRFCREWWVPFPVSCHARILLYALSSSANIVPALTFYIPRRTVKPTDSCLPAEHVMLERRRPRTVSIRISWTVRSAILPVSLRTSVLILRFVSPLFCLVFACFVAIQSLAPFVVCSWVSSEWSNLRNSWKERRAESDGVSIYGYVPGYSECLMTDFYFFAL